MKEMISNRIEYLIGQGEEVLKTRKSPPSNVITSDYVDTGLFTQWKAASTSFLLTVFGKDHSHYEIFVDRCKYPVVVLNILYFIPIFYTMKTLWQEQQWLICRE